jgi:thiol-disulfide isomerase/thioredoxin
VLFLLNRDNSNYFITNMIKYKFFIFFIFGFLIQLIVTSVKSYQEIYYLNVVSFSIYFIFGILFFIKQIEKKIIFIFFIPVFIIKILSLILNTNNFPIDFPIDLIISIYSFYGGYKIKNIFRNVKILVSYFLSIGLFFYTIYFLIPKIEYQKHNFNLTNVETLKHKYWNLKNLNGLEIPFRNTTNKIIVLNFTSKSCKQCIIKMPYIQKIQNKFKGNGNILIYEVDLGSWDTIEEALIFSKKNKNTLNWAYDPNGKLAKSLKFNGAPHEVIIDKKGKIRQIQGGFNKTIGFIYEKKLTDFINKLILE